MTGVCAAGGFPLSALDLDTAARDILGLLLAHFTGKLKGNNMEVVMKEIIQPHLNE